MISLYDLLEAGNGQLFGEPVAQLFVDFSFDAYQPQESHLYVALKTERGDGHDAMEQAVANGATGILCVNPPTFDTSHLSVILTRDTETALLGWARYMAHKHGAHIIAVSGSSGKSTTCHAICEALRSRYNVYYRETGQHGRISLPFALARLLPEHQIVLVELETTYPGEMAQILDIVQPETAVVLHIGESHTANFAGPAQLAADIRLLFEHLPAHGISVLNYDEDLVRGLASHASAPVHTVGIDGFGADYTAYGVLEGPTGTGFDLRVGEQRYVGRWTPLLGRHYLYSTLAAVAVARHYGIPVEDSLNALKNLEPLPGRMKPFLGINGSLIVDDTYTADPQSMLAALDWLNTIRDTGGRTVFVMGDMDHLGNHSPRSHRVVGQHAARRTDILVTEGAQSAHAARGALDEGMSAERVQITYGHENAVQCLYDYELSPNDIVLVKGGETAHMEAVVAALLAAPDDRTLLPRQHTATDVEITTTPLRPSWVEIDLDALANNVRGLKNLIGPKVTLCAVVKADAYGAGAVAVARTALLNGAEYLAVASVAEALDLRESGIDAPILVLSYAPPSAVRQALRHHLTLTVYDLDLLRTYDKIAAQIGVGKVRVHVKIDTGMGRLGVLPSAAMPLFRTLVALKHIELEGVYTHFSAADEDPAYTAEQARVFQGIVKPLRAQGIHFQYMHAANSAGALAFPDYHFDMVRVGLAMHGLSPSEAVPVPDHFQSVMTWKSVVGQVKTLPPGHNVGYGNTYQTEGEERVAVIPVGYADGFRRGPSNAGEVLVRGQLAPVIGRVSMEKTVINVSHIPDVSTGDEVVLLGRQGDCAITADDIARRWGTINYEVVCSVLARIPRR